MCRYAMSTYKPHYACFNCRKSFKRRLLHDINRELHSINDSVSAKCPECTKTMVDMGKDFEAPKKNDIKAWEHIQNLYTSGITFHSCGCTGPGYIPKDKDALLSYLEKIKEYYIKNRRFWEYRNAPKTDSEKQKDWDANKQFLIAIPKDFYEGPRKQRSINEQKAIDYWSKRIVELQFQITKLS